MRSYFTLFFCICIFLNKATAAESFPVSSQGRFLPAESYSVQQLYHLTQRSFSSEKALDTLWQLHFFGPQHLEDDPLIWIQHEETKKILHLSPTQKQFSVKTLRKAFEDSSSNLAALNPLLQKHYAKAFLSPENRSGRTALELKTLSSGLWLEWKKGELIVLAAPATFPWHHLRIGLPIATNFSLPVNVSKDSNTIVEIEKGLSNLMQFDNLRKSFNDDIYNTAYEALANQNLSAKEISLRLEKQHPLTQRLNQSGELFKALPGKFQQGKWYSLDALHAKIYNPKSGTLEPTPNFTLYPDFLFEEIRKKYFALEKAVFAHHAAVEIGVLKDEIAKLLMAGYQNLAQKKYGEAIGKDLTYPSLRQLHAENLYTRYPLILFCMLGYALALLFFSLSLWFKRPSLFSAAFFILLTTFLIHSLLLCLRCYILGRPPVTNMLETLLYVPWVSVAISLILRLFLASSFPLIASASASLSLLILLQLNFYPSELENVQAVLDSHYWLFIHVLMVVGSYGLFLLSSLLGHIYLLGMVYCKRETTPLALMAQSILQTLYIGVALLVGGTLLGGVWAAQSWGRFWDWDPKESWAFISICVYLLWIHAFRFGKIHNYGLAVGSILGFLSISFTWYGVNYILGTGLHSYGFGSGGSFYYYCYLFAELIFLAASVQGYRLTKETFQSPHR